MQKFALATIRFYQRTLSPVIGGGVSCRFTPTCSAYAIEAIERFGMFKGGWLTLCRIAKCNPFGSCGYDPVPMPTQKRSMKCKM